jgi:hypothetical protein
MSKKNQEIRREINEGIEEISENDLIDCAEEDFYDYEYEYPDMQMKKQSKLTWTVAMLTNIIYGNKFQYRTDRSIKRYTASLYVRLEKSLCWNNNPEVSDAIIKFAKDLKSWIKTANLGISQYHMILNIIDLYMKYESVKKMQKDVKKRVKHMMQNYMIPLYGRSVMQKKMIEFLIMHTKETYYNDEDALFRALTRNGRKAHLTYEVIPSKVEKGIRKTIANLFTIHDWHDFIKPNIGLIRSICFQHWKEIENKIHDIASVINIVKLFGGRSHDYIMRMKAHDIRIHDIMSNEWSQILYITEEQIKWIFKIEPKDAVQSHRIIKDWKILESKEWNPYERQAFKHAQVIFSMMTYAEILDHDFALEAAKWRISEHIFNNNQKWWVNREVLTHQTIPAPIGIKKDGYHLYQLDKNDVRTAYIGYYTGCCQHLNGYGDSCARHSISNPDGAVWVVEYQGSILALSWVWRLEEIICLDNVEIGKISTSNKHIEYVKELFIQACHDVRNRLGIERAYIGIGYTDFTIPELAKVTFGLKPNGYHGYSDANYAWQIY